MYFESLKSNYRNDYLTAQPTKAGVLNNQAITGKAEILKDSNNRALKIENENGIFLQSYDTLILKVVDGQIIKMWDGYSVTTLKHINTFLEAYTGCTNTFNKKEWEKFESMNY